MTKKFAFLPVSIPLLILLFSFTLITGDNENVTKNSELFSAFFSETNKYFVDEPDPEKLARTGIDAILKSLDPYSHFVSEKEQEENSKGWKGILYAGIGVNVIMRDSEVTISGITAGYAAARNDLRCGDIILEADGYIFHGLPVDSLVKHLRGNSDTPVEVKIKREGAIFTKSLIREEIRNKAVVYSGMLDDQTGFIHFVHFLEGSSDTLKQAVLELKKQGMKSLVLDIRGNTGGLVMEAVRAVNIFIPKGKNVLSVKGRAKEWNYENPAPGDPIDTLMPLVLLTNENSISAAEIFAGAIQDYDRGVLVGRRTFGKGFVQGTRHLPYGNTVYITSARYYTPSGRCIQELDYTKRDSAGRPVHLADSLKREFKTRNGRKVLDKGGISPDVQVPPEKELSPIMAGMKKANLFFDFANHFRNTHETIANPKEFHLDANQLNDFYRFLEEKKYPFVSPAEEALDAFARKAKEENNPEASSPSIKKLKDDFYRNKNMEVQKYRAEIKTELEKEIVERYFFYEGRVSATLNSDADALEAVSVLKDKKRYQTLLSE